MSWKLWPWGRGGQHRKGGARRMADPAALRQELDEARRRLAAVERREPAVGAAERRADSWLTRNHLAPLFDQAFGAGK